MDPENRLIKTDPRMTGRSAKPTPRCPLPDKKVGPPREVGEADEPGLKEEVARAGQFDVLPRGAADAPGRAGPIPSLAAKATPAMSAPRPRRTQV
jgi:hypothetical protein